MGLLFWGCSRAGVACGEGGPGPLELGADAPVLRLQPTLLGRWELGGHRECLQSGQALADLLELDAKISRTR
jgi:hypothetical protein